MLFGKFTISKNGLVILILRFNTAKMHIPAKDASNRCSTPALAGEPGAKICGGPAKSARANAAAQLERFVLPAGEMYAIIEQSIGQGRAAGAAAQTGKDGTAMEAKGGILVLGHGGFGVQLGELLQSAGYGPVCHLDDGDPACRPFADYADLALRAQYPSALVALGSNALRQSWLQKLAQAGYRVPVFVHAAAVVSPTARLGGGTVVLPFAYVGAGARLGEGCIVNAGAIIDHNASLGDACHAAPGAIIKAGASVEARQKIDSGCVIRSPWERG